VADRSGQHPGLGNLYQGAWVGPHPEREPQVREVLEQVGAAESATVFTGTLGGLDEARRVAAQAWDLADIETAYEEFIDEVGDLRPADPPATLAAQIRLVQEWRRFPLLDPGLPPELLPGGWSGRQAADLFHDRRARWKADADAYWAVIAER
jgi:phenylacetic acid degradation operon negative regulatory protein